MAKATDTFDPFARASEQVGVATIPNKDRDGVNPKTEPKQNIVPRRTLDTEKK